MIKKTTYLNKVLIIFLFGALNLVPQTLTPQNPEPVLLKDINTGPDDSWGMRTGTTAIVNNKLLFTADDGVHGRELWATDGTHTGTYLLKDIYPGPQWSWALYFDAKAVYNGKLYFLADDGTHGLELWTTDGTSSGTQMIKDIKPGAADTVIYQFIEFNGLLYFGTNDSFWVTNGTEAGTLMVKDVRPWEIIEFNNKLYFGGYNAVSGYNLWESDGTQAGTQIIKNIYVDQNNNLPGSKIYNGKIYFSASNGVNGNELWSSDGTGTGTQMVKDIHSGSGHSNPENLIEYNGKLYFKADDGVHGAELWSTDGTEAGTSIVKDIYPGSGNGVDQYDLKTIEYNGKLYFMADDGVHGRELWSTNGTDTGTVMVKDIYPGVSSSLPVGLYEYKGKLFFAANDGVHGSELWSTDGTESGTVMVKDISPGGNHGLVHWDFGLTECNGNLYFGGMDSQFGYNLWESDGTEAGTIMLRPANSTVYDPLIDSFNPVGIVFQNELYFMGMYDESTGIEPYKLSPLLSIDTPQSKNFAFYPNPTDSQLFITADVPVEKAVVYNLQGKLLISHHFRHTPNQPVTIDFSGVSPGVYFVKISGNGWYETHKIIKK